jgi:hypothetical protein
VTLAEYLLKVWEVVGRTALEQVLGTAEARARNGAAGVLEEDARLTALFLWTLQSASEDVSPNANGAQESEDEEHQDDEDDEAPRKSTKSYTLVFDVVRRFAQPLGIHLPEWEGRIIETKNGTVRLLPVSERAKQLFGEDGAHVVADQLESAATASRSPQLTLFPHEEIPNKRPKGRKAKTKLEISDEALRPVSSRSSSRWTRRIRCPRPMSGSLLSGRVTALAASKFGRSHRPNRRFDSFVASQGLFNRCGCGWRWHHRAVTSRTSSPLCGTFFPVIIDTQHERL